MKQETWSQLEAAFDEHRDVLVAGPVPSTLVEETIARLGGPSIADYVEFVTRYGGAMVGANPVHGIQPSNAMGSQSTVEAETLRFRKDGWPGTSDGLVVSVDARGNPVVLGADGQLTSFDHDTGETHVVAAS